MSTLHLTDNKLSQTENLQDSVELSQGSNSVLVLQGKIALEAVEDKILIQIDKFKTGYECATCNETGRLKECPCVTAGRPGHNIAGGHCKICDGNFFSMKDVECPDCKGRGVTLVVPDNAKGIPTSGVIMSVGPECKKRKLFERVLFGAHTGYYIPFKGAVKIRCMREDEPLCIIHGVQKQDDLRQFMELDERAE